MELKNKKASLGQFFTKNDFWLKDSVLEFMNHRNFEIALDPFAGEGDLLNLAKKVGIAKTIGFDIDKNLNWPINDSLVSIKKFENSIIITNPPYLSNYSAKRKGIYNNVLKYFQTTKYDDLYFLAIEKCMENNEYGIMIIPETFINSSFNMSRIYSITIIEENIFNDTENPICVICFDNFHKALSQIKVYKNDRYIDTLGNLELKRKYPKNNFEIKFNTIDGNIGLRAVDTTNQNNPIRFMLPHELNYDLKNIKVSSRLITLIKVPLNDLQLDELVKKSNLILDKLRIDTKDIILSPFKGNKKNGERRRRLDYKTARAILEEALESILYDKITH